MKEFREDGSDVACQYDRDDGGILTLYFSDFDPMTANQHVEMMIPAIREDKGFKLDEDVSLMCELTLGLGEVTEGDGPKGDTEIIIGETPCAVLRGDDLTSVVAVRTYGDWHFKVRLTDTSSELDGDVLLYTLTGEIFALQDKSIRLKEAVEVPAQTQT